MDNRTTNLGWLEIQLQTLKFFQNLEHCFEVVHDDIATFEINTDNDSRAIIPAISRYGTIVFRH